MGGGVRPLWRNCCRVVCAIAPICGVTVTLTATAQDSMYRQRIGTTLYSTIMLFLLVGAKGGAISARSQAVKLDTRQIELTETDLFSRKDWNSTEIRVLGFHLGMTRRDADENARQRDLSLVSTVDSTVCHGKICEVCDARDICPGVTLSFGDSERIDRMDVSRIPEDAAAEVRRAAIVLRFKGSTYQLFNHYSEALRIRLLGPGVLVSKQVYSPPKVPGLDVTYDYPERGLQIYASVDESSHEKPVDFDLMIMFRVPGTARWRPTE
jgi:hypothetical protein